jgi:hypothetical protein
MENILSQHFEPALPLSPLDTDVVFNESFGTNIWFHEESTDYQQIEGFYGKDGIGSFFDWDFVKNNIDAVSKFLSGSPNYTTFDGFNFWSITALSYDSSKIPRITMIRVANLNTSLLT